jgi:glycosyltransferase involved in cell wall biosynthesis
LFKLLDGMIYRHYARIIAVSEAVAGALRRWLPEVGPKLAVVPNAVDPRGFHVAATERDGLRQTLGLGADEQVVLFVGRLMPAKGVDVLLEALNQLPSSAKFKMLVVGPGPLRAALEQQVPERLRAQVSFLGARSDVPTLLAAADLLVLPSRWEGLPVILLEAMAARLPILATRVGGIPEVLEHGVSGWLVPPEDAPALAEGMTHLLQSKPARARQAEAAWQILLDRFSPEVTLRQLLGVYQAVLEARP